MDNLDDSENNAKISDSAYSNSCSNSQSRRSHSSKSTHSGSHSSGSSGYGGKPSTSGFSNNVCQPPEKRSKEKDTKKKKQSRAETLPVVTPTEKECISSEQAPVIEDVKDEIIDEVARLPSPVLEQTEKGAEIMDTSTTPRDSSQEEDGSCNMPPLVSNSLNCVAHRSTLVLSNDGFSCVISMHDGVVIYTTSSLTTSLGFPKHMWIGRSFIDFVHPRDRNTFASQITSGLAVPKNVNGMQEKVPTNGNSVSTMVCRIRRYRGLINGFGVKDRVVTYVPFLLKLSFKNITDEEGKVIYLVIQATQFTSAFKTPNELLKSSVPFVIRHAANGNLEYIDPESVPYLGFLPQDVVDKNALQFYHSDDLCYLQQVYETIVKEGVVPRSKSYRMMTQNGDYLRVETEWSSFINPWSRKLEFVIGKHHIVEGPLNPDVFQPPNPDNSVKLSEEEKNKIQFLRERIIRIMNEVLTKPAEAAKQHMTKRCQDLASFMESLIEEQPKAEEELRLEIQDPDHSYYERDSVMLGGISPHHEYNDSKSSTETPLSYNQLNYNETLQRYFDSHQPFSYEDYITVTGENILGLRDSKSMFISGCLSPMAQNSGDSADLSLSDSSGLASSNSAFINLGNYQTNRLTEMLLNKHNTEMEKELMKTHRENRTSSKSEREKASNESRQKKKEHLARCNSAYQPTSQCPTTAEFQPHGVKRASKQIDVDTSAYKHHCSSQRQSRRRQTTSGPPVLPSSTVTTTVAAASHWPNNPMANMNTFLLGVGIPQQMSIMNPMSNAQGMFPLYYTPSAGLPMTTNSNVHNAPHFSNNNGPCQQPVVQCVMYGQAVYGSPLMYTPPHHHVNPQVSYPLQENLLTQTLQFSNVTSPMTSKTNRDQKISGVCKALSLKAKNHSSSIWRDKRGDCQPTSSKMGNESFASGSINQDSGDNQSLIRNRIGNRKLEMRSSMRYSGKSTEAVPASLQPMSSKGNHRLANSEETIDKTDGESSYSSFYSSFFKTDSGSAEDSGDANKSNGKKKSHTLAMDTSSVYYETQMPKKVPKRKMEPPWMEQVNVTPELMYKYQVLTKNLEEVLNADKQKMTVMEQPSLVNEQLGQLYLDLQLEGVAARLTLEEGITSSSSSGEESSSKPTRGVRRKREYSKLVMIYEEDMPLPSPLEEEQSGSRIYTSDS